MADEIKRLNYFEGQLLSAADLQAEQEYHVHQRRRGNRVALSPGVVEGLELSGTAGQQQFTVSPGLALDQLGREIILLPPAGGAPLPARPIPPGLTDLVHVVIRYGEALTDPSPAGDTRITEQPQIELQVAPPPGSVLLGRLNLDVSGRILALDTELRSSSALRLPQRSNRLRQHLRLGPVQMAWGRGTLRVTNLQPVVAESIVFPVPFAAESLPAVTVSLEPPGDDPDFTPDQFRGAFVASNVTRDRFSVTYSTVNPLRGGYEASYSWMAIGAWTSDREA